MFLSERCVSPFLLLFRCEVEWEDAFLGPKLEDISRRRLPEFSRGMHPQEVFLAVNFLC